MFSLIQSAHPSLRDGLRLAREVMTNPDSDDATRVVALTVLSDAYESATPDELREHEEAMDELARILENANAAR